MFIFTYMIFLPIMWLDGVGSEVMQRIAAPMIGGMVSALVLTLLVLPAAYYLWRSRTLKTLEHTTSQTDTPTAP